VVDSAVVEGTALVFAGPSTETEVALPLGTRVVESLSPLSRSPKSRSGISHPDTVEEPMQKASRPQIRLRMGRELDHFGRISKFDFASSSNAPRDCETLGCRAQKDAALQPENTADPAPPALLSGALSSVGYSHVIHIDCDDADPTRQLGQYWYPDTDGDGWGAPHGPIVLRCEGDMLAGATRDSSDCDDANALLQERGYPDADGDGQGAGARACGSDEGTSDSDADCDDHDRTVYRESWHEVPGDGINSDCDFDGNDFPWQSTPPSDAQVTQWAADAPPSPGCEAGVDLYVLYAVDTADLCLGCVTQLGVCNRGGITASAMVLKLTSDQSEVGIPVGSLEPQAWVRIPNLDHYPIEFTARLESADTECTPEDNRLSVRGKRVID
jgi:hypothetical protein